MDKYYNTRWVEEYGRVKSRMAKEYALKISEIEENFNIKMAEM